MSPQDSPEGVHQSQGNLWIYAGVPALLIIGYLIYSAVSQAKDRREAHENAPPAESPADSSEGK